MNTEHRPHTVLEFCIEIDPAFTANLIVDPGLLDFEARGVDQGVNGVGLILEDRAIAGDLWFL